MNKVQKIHKLKVDIQANIEKSDLLFEKRTSMRAELFELEWPVMEWYELENWLKKNRPENNYRANPRVKRFGSDFHETYCNLNEDGKLQIGGHEHNDNFPQGKPLRVSYNFERWR